MRSKYAIGLVVGAVLLGWSCDPDQGTGSQEQQTLAPLKIGYLPIAECAHLYVAISNGYFESEGLEVDLQPMRGGATILPALQQGDLDVGFSNLVSMIMFNSAQSPSEPGWFISLAGGTYERPGFTNHALLIRSDDQVSLDDIGSGEVKVALNTTRNIEELMLRKYLLVKGVEQRRLNIIQIAFPEMVPALVREDVDVASVVEPFIEPPIQEGHVRKLATQYQEVSDNTAVATYAVTSEWAKQNPDAVGAFARAIEAADDFINKNELATRQIIGTFTRIREEDLPIIGLPAFESSISVDSLEYLAEGMLQFHFIDAAPNLREMIYDE